MLDVGLLAFVEVVELGIVRYVSSGALCLTNLYTHYGTSVSLRDAVTFGLGDDAGFVIGGVCYLWGGFMAGLILSYDAKG